MQDFQTLKATFLCQTQFLECLNGILNHALAF